jgi:DNA transposition AAA+ family ATPase
MKKKVKFTPTFVNTTNERNFESMMRRMEMGDDEGRFGVVYSQAGRGKSRTAQRYAAHNGCVYLPILKVWKTSELEFLLGLCRALNMQVIPKRKGPCFLAIVDELLINTRPVFLDEFERLPGTFLDLAKDLTDITMAPFILLGEEEILYHMRKNRRVWSRTHEQLNFKNIGIGDVVSYVSACTSMKLNDDVDKMLHKATEGNLRLLKRATLTLVQIANAKGTDEVSAAMVKTAIGTGLSGVKRKGRGYEA